LNNDDFSMWVVRHIAILSAVRRLSKRTAAPWIPMAQIGV
jgi:hypothetical protein